MAAAAGRHGLDADVIVESALSSGTGQPTPEVMAARLLGPDGLTFGSSSFSRDDVLRAVCEALPPGCPVDLTSLRDVTAAVIDDTRAVPLDAALMDGPQRWTARSLLRTEEQALAFADALRATPHVPGSGRDAAALGEFLALSGEQQALVAAITSDRSSLSVVVGPAGAGKTAALAAARQHWDACGIRVHGVALAGLAARELREGSGIASSTLAQTRATIERGAFPLCAPGEQVIVVDEAGMVGTRDLAFLLRHAHEHGRTHLVLVGDPCQLPEIEAGGLFARLAEGPTAVLTENRRQVAAWEQRALARLRAGDTAAALDQYWTRGRITFSAPPDELVTAIADDFVRLRQDPGTTVGVPAATRAQAAAVNDAIRERLAAGGRPSGPGLELTSSPARSSRGPSWVGTTSSTMR